MFNQTRLEPGQEQPQVEPLESSAPMRARSKRSKNVVLFARSTFAASAIIDKKMRAKISAEVDMSPPLTKCVKNIHNNANWNKLLF